LEGIQGIQGNWREFSPVTVASLVAISGRLFIENIKLIDSGVARGLGQGGGQVWLRGPTDLGRNFQVLRTSDESINVGVRSPQPSEANGGLFGRGNPQRCGDFTSFFSKK